MKGYTIITLLCSLSSLHSQLAAAETERESSIAKIEEFDGAIKLVEHLLSEAKVRESKLSVQAEEKSQQLRVAENQLKTLAEELLDLKQTLAETQARANQPLPSVAPEVCPHPKLALCTLHLACTQLPC